MQFNIPDQDFSLQMVNLGMASHFLMYYQLNQQHLSHWEPVREQNYYTVQYWKQQLQSMVADQRNGKGYYFVIQRLNEPEIIGVCNFSNVIRGVFQACYLGYSIGEKYQGQGLMYQSLLLLIDFMFKEKKLHRIMANYLPDNHRSAALLQRLGFEREGFAKAYLKINGQWQDHILTSLINTSLAGSED